MKTQDCFPKTVRRSVEEVSVYLLIADISGYTQFLQEHADNLAHAERVVGELLESLIGAIRLPLNVYQVAGDAVSFYAESSDDPTMAKEILDQVQRLFETFNARMKEILRCPAIAACSSCRKVGDLRLKVVAHHGDVVLTEVGGFKKIAGPAMVLSHRLLKNSLQQDEYLLVTGDFYARCEDMIWERALWKSEYYDGFGDVLVLVQFPAGVVPRISRDGSSFALHRSNMGRRIVPNKRRRAKPGSPA